MNRLVVNKKKIYVGRSPSPQSQSCYTFMTGKMEGCIRISLKHNSKDMVFCNEMVQNQITARLDIQMLQMHFKIQK